MVHEWLMQWKVWSVYFIVSLPKSPVQKFMLLRPLIRNSDWDIFGTPSFCRAIAERWLEVVHNWILHQDQGLIPFKLDNLFSSRKLWRMKNLSQKNMSISLSMTKSYMLCIFIWCIFIDHLCITHSGPCSQCCWSHLTVIDIALDSLLCPSWKNIAMVTIQ